MYENYRARMTRHGAYMGEIMRQQTHMVMDATWMNSVATRPVQVHIIDSGLPPIYSDVEEFDEVLWAHYDTHTKYNITSDEVDYYLTFRPGEMTNHPEIRVGAYVCIPDIDNVFNYWLICHIDDDNELRKCQIIKCNWTFKWIANGKIYQCLGCQRYSNSYNCDHYICESIVNLLELLELL